MSDSIYIFTDASNLYSPYQDKNSDKVFEYTLSKIKNSVSKNISTMPLIIFCLNYDDVSMPQFHHFVSIGEIFYHLLNDGYMSKADICNLSEKDIKSILKIKG